MANGMCPIPQENPCPPEAGALSYKPNDLMSSESATESKTQSAIVPAEARATPGGFPFRWVLPLGQLVVCAVLLWPARPRIAYGLGLPMLASPPLIFRLGGPLQVFANWSKTYGMQTVGVINLPAVVFEVPWMLFDKNWAQHGLDWQVRRAITWPILGMVFWWMAGRGAQALSAVRRKKLVPRIGWIETVIGFVLLAAGATMVIGVEFFSGADRHSLQPAAAVAGMWAFLGGLSVAGKMAQWGLRKALAAK